MNEPTVPSGQPANDEPSLTTVHEIAHWVRGVLGAEFPPATNGVWIPGDGRVVTRLGVALAGSKEVVDAARDRGVDALLLHRPWHLGPLPPTIGVLAFHEALDERLTTGNNPWLAQKLAFKLADTIGERYGRPIVAIAQAEENVTFAEVIARVRHEFPTFEIWNPQPPAQPVELIALANAMRPALVACAASRGAALYLTGTLRSSAEPMLVQTQMTALGLGHVAIERWGLRWLADTIQSHFGIEAIWLD